MPDEPNQTLAGLVDELPHVLGHLCGVMIGEVVPRIARVTETLDDHILIASVTTSCPNGCCVFTTTVTIRRGGVDAGAPAGVRVN